MEPSGTSNPTAWPSVLKIACCDLVLMSALSILSGAVVMFANPVDPSSDANMKMLFEWNYLVAVISTVGVAAFFMGFLAEWSARKFGYVMRSWPRTLVSIGVMYVVTGWTFVWVLSMVYEEFLVSPFRLFLNCCLLFGPALAPLAYRLMGRQKSYR